MHLRHHRHWLLAGTFFTLSAAALVACVSDDDGDQGQTDAGHDATADVVTAHDTSVPDTNIPVVDANLPDTNVPDTNTNVPDTNVADTNVADTSTADTNVADTNVADTNIADTNVPDTNVADTSTADAADSASSACAPADAGDAGYATVAKDWSFAVSTNTLNGGKGQVFTVNRCDTVVWTNTDTAPHSVIGTGTFAFSTNQNNGGAFTPVQFTKAGTFTYHCGVHGNMMIGEITVQ